MEGHSLRAQSSPCGASGFQSDSPGLEQLEKVGVNCILDIDMYHSPGFYNNQRKLLSTLMYPWQHYDMLLLVK